VVAEEDGNEVDSSQQPVVSRRCSELLTTDYWLLTTASRTFVHVLASSVIWLKSRVTVT